jgi:tyrosyl-tRNA synthetase
MTAKENNQMTLYEELRARGLIAQTTGEDEVAELINNGKATFYIGYDPTADSLHVGHFMPLSIMRRLQEAGNRPIALVGGGTGMVGDPSGRTDMRKVMTVETIDEYCERFKVQMSRFLDFSEGRAIMVNNADWLRGLNYVEFLRDIGAHFSVNRMLAAECYKQRLEKGLSFLEFNYMVMQAYDFYELFLRYGCNMQLGGDDQWSNMLAGTELIRRKLSRDAHVFTITLLPSASGEKMGKTSGGAVWLDADKTSPFELYQYYRNVDDGVVIKYLKMLTFLPLEQILEMESWRDKQLNDAKEVLAYEIVSLIHGTDAAAEARETSRALFTSGGAADMPETSLTEADFTDDAIDILAILQKSGLVTSRSEARRAVEQGGVEVDGEKITDIAKKYAPDELSGEGLVVRRGKKSYKRIKRII